MYLTGFTLFLSLILTRTYYILLDLIHAQEQYAELKKVRYPVRLSCYFLNPFLANRGQARRQGPQRGNCRVEEETS